jgi:hypothetical protein
MSRSSKLYLFSNGLHTSGLSYPDSDGLVDQVIVTDGNGNLSFADQSGGGGGGSIDSAATINIINDQILLLDVGDIVGADGNPGEYLQSDGNGNTSWVDGKLEARQKAFAISLIFG